MIRLAVEGGAGRLVSAAARQRLVAGMERALIAAGEGAAEVSILLCDDARIRLLNRGYADEDHATDVLSFSQREGWGAPEAGLLGDIVVSMETAARQAAARPGPASAALEAELLHLCVHGLGHLLGLDHDTPVQQQAMWAREAELRDAALGRPRRQRTGMSRGPGRPATGATVPAPRPRRRAPR
jgi:probable rRNA maturation factor